MTCVEVRGQNEAEMLLGMRDVLRRGWRSEALMK